MFQEGGFIGLRQAHLANGCCCLQVMHGTRPRGPAQALHAGGNRAGGDQQHLPPVGVQRGDLPRAFGDEIVGQALALPRHQRAADLDHQALRVSYPPSHGDAFGIRDGP